MLPDAGYDLQEFTHLITHAYEVLPSSQLTLLRNENIAPFFFPIFPHVAAHTASLLTGSVTAGTFNPTVTSQLHAFHSVKRGWSLRGGV